jgi:hypothetical protein
VSNVTGESLPAAGSAAPSFPAQVDLIAAWLARRRAIVEQIETLLNAQRKPLEYCQDTRALAQHLDAIFFGRTAEQRMLGRQLDEAHWASGFRPRETPGLHNDLVDPAEMMARAFLLWRQTRWPGNHGRGRYAETLFALFVLRRLMLLSLRLWDGAPGNAGERLAQLQGLLDELWRTAPANQPVFVRDARWLIPFAQSPTTDDLRGYFHVAERVAEELPEADRLAVHRASVVMAGGHLRSQLRHLATQRGVALDDPTLVNDTRRSNALDLALLVQGLVPLLEAYERAREADDEQARREWAAAIFQGISPDPELFVNRLDLLGPYGMIEHLFVTAADDGQAGYTPTGERHQRLLREYEERIGRLAQALHDDCGQFRPIAGRYSPYGVLYGFSSQLLEHMALKSLQAEAPTRFSLEHAFVDGGAEELAWVSGWRKLPHVPPEVAKLFEYPQHFADEIFERIERALGNGVTANVAAGRLVVATDTPVTTAIAAIPELAPHYFKTSDRALAAAGTAGACPETELLHCRTEGEFLVSYRTAGGWVGLSKDVLTELVGAGRDARVVGLPAKAAAVLRQMCPRFVTSPGRAPGEPR